MILYHQFIFNLVADMLAILIARAKEDGQVEGLIPHLVGGGCLFYNVRMIQLFLWITNPEKALNMKLILCIFEQLSGLKINFHNSEIFCFGQ